ncbi:MAG: VOC family protein [Sciscionella sp.]
MSATAVWLPFAVADIDAAECFYANHLGLSRVDSWATGSERGVVLRAAGPAHIELVSPGTPGPVPLAFELADSGSVDRSYAEWGAGIADVIAQPHLFPRGHYGFEVRGPAGAHVLVWSENT